MYSLVQKERRAVWLGEDGLCFFPQEDDDPVDGFLLLLSVLKRCRTDKGGLVYWRRLRRCRNDVRTCEFYKQFALFYNDSPGDFGHLYDS
jgi:hypothetical protein